MSRRISILESIDLLWRITILVPICVVFNIVRITRLALRRGLPVGDYCTVAIIRTFLTYLTPRQIVFVSPSTSKTYKNWIKTKAGIVTTPVQYFASAEAGSSVSDVCPKILWIRTFGRQPSKIILFFHGGGYNAPLTRGHLEWCAKLVESFHEKGVCLAVAILEYSLTPQHRYPSQLQQARDGLAYLLHAGFEPNQILIGGDSAGGNLTLALLSHLMHPHPSIEALVCSKPLAAVFLISPWLTDDMSTRSFQQNATIDMLSPALVKRSTNDFIPNAALREERERGQGWAFALHSPHNWWDGLGSVVSQLYITTGEQEMFCDHTIDFAKMLQSQSEKTKYKRCIVQLEVGVNEAHDHLLMWELRGGTNPALRRMIMWMSLIIADT